MLPGLHHCLSLPAPENVFQRVVAVEINPTGDVGGFDQEAFEGIHRAGGCNANTGHSSASGQTRHSSKELFEGGMAGYLGENARQLLGSLAAWGITCSPDLCPTHIHGNVGKSWR